MRKGSNAKTRRNGDETAHVLADKCAIGQPVEFPLIGWPNFRGGYGAAEIFPLGALKCHLPITSRQLPACFSLVPHCCSPTAGDGVVRILMDGVCC